MPDTFYLDDLRFYIGAFRNFGERVEGLVDAPSYPEQYSLDRINSRLRRELEEDTEYQIREWIKKDRALEAIPLMESDGVSIDDRAVLNDSGYTISNNRSEDPFINLIKTNRDRVVSQLQAVDLNMQARPKRRQDQDGVESINALKRKVLKNNNFEKQKLNYIRDGATYGSGVFYLRYGQIEDSPDIRRLYRTLMAGREALTIDEFAKLKRAIFGHKLEHISTFELIRYRGARGPQAADINHSSHRWTHWVRQRPIPEVRRDFPQRSEEITPATNDSYERANPYSYRKREENSSITQMDHWIRFPVSGEATVDVINPATNKTETIPMPLKRYAVGRITRLEGVGIVDMEMDRYLHNMIPMFTWNYEPASRHSCGIGIVKYGRDPQVIHDILHTGMMVFFDTMAKGGGFVDERLGLTREDLEALSEEGTYVPVEVPDKFSDHTLDDFVVDTSPSSFPSVYAELMNFHSRSMDMAMSVPNAYKGIQSGTSGRQEEVLTNQAQQVHNVTQANLSSSIQNFAIGLFSNIVQFERDPYEFYVDNGTQDNRQRYEVNKPEGWYLKYDYKKDTYQAVPYGVKNDIQSLLFDVDIGTKSVVPSQPAQRANFITQFFERTKDAVTDPRTRIWIDELNKSTLHIPRISEAIQRIEEREREIQQQEAQADEREKNLERLKADREWVIEKIETVIESKKVDQQMITNALEAALKNREQELKQQEMQQSKSNQEDQ